MKNLFILIFEDWCNLHFPINPEINWDSRIKKTSSKFYAQYEIYWKVIEAFHFQQIVIWPANNSNFLGKNILVPIKYF